MSGGAGPGAGAEPFPHVTEEDAGMGIETTHWTPRTGDTQRPPTAEPKAAEKTIAPTTTATTATTDTTSVRDSGDPAAPPVSASPTQTATSRPQAPWTTSTLIGLKAFWRWFLTIPGFFITLYGLNVVAWGGMLFLLLCNAAPAMCHPSCNHINSARRIWVEITSQILNALFCVTGFGLAPWRFRDLWFLIQARTGWYGPGATKEEKKVNGWRRLAGINRSWFRLPGSDKLSLPSADEVPDELNPALPLPPSKRPDEPLTGVRSPPTKKWKMDFVIWMNVWNTFFQIALCVCMWAYNRIERPAWSTGLFVALACGVAGAAGIMMFVEGKKVKKVEGVPPKVEQKVRDVEEGMEMRDEVDKKGAAKAKKEGEGEGFRKKLSKFSG
ncbi:hypothetical protein H2199_007512 [Coniosporium tulheliwenetii]|uniref:Uncharacterized protein n=1 Tax=Coniosporium tulheliwenetii TaxID=3383036 RepID=A0ACC2YPJ4_9PEZI|nr:hypothetical protein H2199_007512 [Cladosporium sp. JES 115]